MDETIHILGTDGTTFDHRYARYRTHDGVLTITENPNSAVPRYFHYPLCNVVRFWTGDR